MYSLLMAGYETALWIVLGILNECDAGKYADASCDLYNGNSLSKKQGSEDNGDERHEIMIDDRTGDTEPLHPLIPEAEGDTAGNECRKPKCPPCLDRHSAP